MMGRFASTVDFYAKYREPYPAAFFETVAMRLALRGNESLLDVGCGPGLLAIGFAPYVRHSTGLDPEPAMIGAAVTAAAAAGLPIRFLTGRIEEFTTVESFAVVTIGRALHWLDQDAAMPVLERIVSPSGRIVICGASASRTRTLRGRSATRMYAVLMSRTLRKCASGIGSIRRFGLPNQGSKKVSALK
jgi:ubiquinone/menaquinone biosynthesis C-methylase UbiE